MNHQLMIVMICLLCLPCVATAAESEYPRPELLLEPAELAQADVARKFVILDVRGADDFAKEHIPNARRVDHEAWKAAFGDGTDAKGWSKRIGELGIGRDSKVVVYDDQQLKDAARIWWILRYWGVSDVRLLNGGWKTWKAEDLPTSDETPQFDSTQFDAEPHSKRLATKGQLLDLLKQDEFQIIDARSHDEYCGLAPGKNKRAGAMPGAKHLEWSDLVDPKTDRIKPPTELGALFEKAGIDLNKPAATHCQSGGRSSVMAFGLELMGARDVRNYYNGWSEWGNVEGTPVVVPEKDK